MSNHVHIILKDDNEMLSTAMRRLNSRYAMYYNRKNCKVGYVFSNRFKSEERAGRKNNRSNILIIGLTYYN